MKLEDAVCSLELAKKLKDLGVKQESFFRHINISIYERVDKLKDRKWFIESAAYPSLSTEKYSAFTVPELLEIFPIKNYHYKLIKEKDNEYLCSHYSREEYLIFRDENSANACAKMLIHIIENKLYDPNEREYSWTKEKRK